MRKALQIKMQRESRRPLSDGRARERLNKEVSVMVWLRISPEMDFYVEMELQGVTEKTRGYDLDNYEKAVYREFVERLKKAFPEGDVRIHSFDFDIAREKTVTKKVA